jgi:putative nucleotidyltransferase with HDIG domain
MKTLKKTRGDVLNSAPSPKPTTRDRQTGIEKRKESVRRIFLESRYFRWFLLLGVTAVFTILLHPKMVMTGPNYKPGDVAERDIKAPQNFFIKDSDATEINRKRTVQEVLTVYDHDTGLLPALNTRIENAFAELRAVMEEDAAPELLRSVAIYGRAVSPRPDIRLPQDSKQVWEHKDAFVQQVGIDIKADAFNILVKEAFSKDIVDAIKNILTVVLEKGVVSNKTMLLKDGDKGIVLKDLGTKEEQVITDLIQFYDLDQAKSMVRIAGEAYLKEQNYTSRSLVIDLAQKLIQPNITLNKSETEERKQKAADATKPVLYKIKAGEMLLREGERVTDIQLLKLEALKEQMQKDNLVTRSIGIALLVMLLLVAAVVLYRPNFGRKIEEQNKSLLFVAVVLMGVLVTAHLSVYLSESLAGRGSSELAATSIVYGAPIASGAMIVCLFLGFELAVPCAAIIAILVAMIFQTDFTLFIYFLLNGTMAAYWIRNCRERKVFIKAGTKLGILNMILVTAIDVFLTQLTGKKLLWDWTFGFLGGIGSGIVAAGIIPMVEIAFDYTTDIKLLELANLDRPILRKLLIEAPGTYHHSVIVGSMVEAAAAEIGVNSLLAKVCGYYHDIGKIKKPLYFIENQRDGKNKHDKLAPSMSSLILVAHVKDGVEIAKNKRLGSAIFDTIQQHHGTSLITYFYEKARQQRGEDVVNIDDFRYPGPKPQTRVVALVMLADVVEAASRTLANPTPSRIQGLVQNLINKVFSDGQLDNCDLTLRDLHKIASSFNKILNAIHHHRIEYPELRSTTTEIWKNGNPDRQPAKQSPDSDRKNTEKGARRIKRLGQS